MQAHQNAALRRSDVPTGGNLAWAGIKVEGSDLADVRGQVDVLVGATLPSPDAAKRPLTADGILERLENRMKKIAADVLDKDLKNFFIGPAGDGQGISCKESVVYETQNSGEPCPLLRASIFQGSSGLSVKFAPYTQKEPGKNEAVKKIITLLGEELSPTFNMANAVVSDTENKKSLPQTDPANEREILVSKLRNKLKGKSGEAVLRAVIESLPIEEWKYEGRKWKATLGPWVISVERYEREGRTDEGKRYTYSGSSVNFADRECGLRSFSNSYGHFDSLDAFGIGVGLPAFLSAVVGGVTGLISSSWLAVGCTFAALTCLSVPLAISSIRTNKCLTRLDSALIAFRNAQA